MKSICVYCGCSDRIQPAYLESARQMGWLGYIYNLLVVIAIYLGQLAPLASFCAG